MQDTKLKHGSVCTDHLLATVQLGVSNIEYCEQEAVVHERGQERTGPPWSLKCPSQ